MAVGDDIELMSNVALLKAFDTEQLRLLAFGAQRRSLRTDEQLYREGSHADGGFIIVSGKIDLMTSVDDKEVLLQSFGPGSLIGEMALITKTVHIASAKASEDTELIRLSRINFLRVLEEFPDLAIELHQKISADVSEMVDKMDLIRARLEA